MQNFYPKVAENKNVSAENLNSSCQFSRKFRNVRETLSINFGANTPLKCLTKEILQHSPKMICISATIIADVELLARDEKTASA